MILNNVKRLISLGMKATRLDQKQTKAELKRLAADGIVEAKHAARLATSVLAEANRERKVITAFMLKEMEKEIKAARPHAKRAAVRARRLGGRIARAASRMRKGQRFTKGRAPKKGRR